MFITSVRHRLRLPLSAPGATCTATSAGGQSCGTQLDQYNHHARSCQFGPGRVGRHDAVRNWLLRWLQPRVGPVELEPRNPHWDRPGTPEARLDLSYVMDVLRHWKDVAVVGATSAHPALCRAAARTDAVRSGPSWPATPATPGATS